MHYKNGREAKEGDKVITVSSQQTSVVGVLHSVVSGSDTCNGRVAPIGPNDPYINISDCLHLDDIEKAEVPDSTKD